MSYSPLSPGILPGRLPDQRYQANFGDLQPAYDAHEAQVAADRCYFCHDAPCVTACPTAIDIPLFIRQIGTGTPEAAARTILAQNIFGGMCARVCPTETLCEEACVREAAEGKPVEIGRLQRYATDRLIDAGLHPFARAAATGFVVAVVGAGPAGLSAAHRLAMLGHEAVVFDGRPKAGGLNEYGIAAYKAAGDFAAREVAWLLQIGGIRVVNEVVLGRDIALADLQKDFDAVFLGVGLASVNRLAVPGADLGGVQDAVEFIAALRQADKAGVPVGRDVVVIGGGMTAVDAGVQARLLGALNVTIVYRGPQARMGASRHEQDHATSSGVRILCEAAPVAIHGEGRVSGVEFAFAGGERFVLSADQVLCAIGQRLAATPAEVVLEGGKIAVDAAGRSSIPGVWAGGDCAAGGRDLTVTAVAEGRDAAMDIHATLMARARAADARRAV